MLFSDIDCNQQGKYQSYRKLAEAVLVLYSVGIPLGILAFMVYFFAIFFLFSLLHFNYPFSIDLPSKDERISEQKRSV